MKKFLAVILAIVTAMSMASVSFAEWVSSESLFVFDEPLDLDDDTNNMTADVTGIQYGDTVYFSIYDQEDYFRRESGGFLNGIASKKFMENVKIKTTFEMGEDIVESVEIVKMNASIDGKNEYAEYFIAVKLADKAVTYDTDVIGTFEIDRKALKAKDIGLDHDLPKVDGMTVDFAFPVFYTRNWNAFAEDFLVEDEVNLKYDEAYALKFDYDDEAEIVFGGKDGRFGDEQNEGVFTVDVSGQGKVFIKWNTEPDEAIAAANEGKEMYFVNFGGVKFNRAGEYVYELEDAAAAYEVVDGKLVEIPGVEIEDDEITFRTNKLGSYVFAKSELVNP